MNILLIDPYFTGSHKSWAEGYKANSQHQVDILEMKGQFWKWRMHGGAVTMARLLNQSDLSPDVILATDMLDLTTFLSLTRKRTSSISTAIYFHENQLSYPWSPKDRDVQKDRNKQYGFINYNSALTADYALFNSHYHQISFLEEAEKLLKHFPDYNELDTIKIIEDKSSVLPLGLDLHGFDTLKSDYEGPPLILWNHRWEYDKNPESFFKTLFKLDDNGIDFKLAVLGENFKSTPSIFDEANIKLKDKIVHFGYCEDFSEYAQWLWKADILPVTNIQDFFGISIMEAVYCNTYLLLPNRLTYPELLPTEYHDNHIYEDDKDLYEKLNECISKIDEIRNKKMSSVAEKYDWRQMAPVYDKLFGSFI